MPSGRRREAQAKALTTQVFALFGGRILSFDAKAAEAFAKTNASANENAQAQGNTMGSADCAIGAIARPNGFALATCNQRDFKGPGVSLIDPWAFAKP